MLRPTPRTASLSLLLLLAKMVCMGGIIARLDAFFYFFFEPDIDEGFGGYALFVRYRGELLG